MRIGNLNLLGFGAALGERHSVPAAHVADGHVSLSVSDVCGPDLAVTAGHRALAAAALTNEAGGWLRPAPPELHLHSSIWRDPVEFWGSSSYVLAELGASESRGSTLTFSAMSASALLAVEWMARHLAGSPDVESGLYTGGDQYGAYGAPAMDRHTADRGILYGDGGSSLVLGRRPGLARLLGTATRRCPPLEGLHRGHEWSSVHAQQRPPVDLRTRKRDWIAAPNRSVAEVDRANARGMSGVAAEALRDCDARPGDARWVITPWYGDALLRRHVLEPLGVRREQTTADLGAHLGHLGPHDQLVSLSYLWAHELVEPGDLVLVVGAGVGMTWAAAALEVTAVPAGMASLIPAAIADLGPLLGNERAAA